MAAYSHNTGGVVFYDSLTGGSAVAALDTHTISNQTIFTIRTDTYACSNHSTAVGSLDTVTFTGTGGELRFDPTYVRHVSYTGGSGVSPAFGSTISQGGVSGVFLGAWTTWQSEPIVPGSAIGVSGFIKIGGTTGGEWTAGALTGVSATCLGASSQSFIEIRGADTATITVPRVGKVESVEAWFEIGTTTGVRGQVIPCPTTATLASTFPGVWIETAAGSGVYEPYASVGAVVALATHRTDDSMKVITQTTSGIRIGNDGTNFAFYLPPTGCKVRIPAIILTNCTRTTAGSGPRVLPNATVGTRQELVTTGAGYFDLRGMVSQWYMNLQQAFYVKYKSCAVSDLMNLYEIASPLDVDDCIVAPTAAQINTALNVISCFAGGKIKNSVFNVFSLAAAGRYAAQLHYVTGVQFTNNKYLSATLRGHANTGVITSTQAVDCTFTDQKFIGGRGLFVGAQRCTFNGTVYYDHTITTTTSATNPMYVLDFSTGCSGIVVNGFALPLPANGPYNGLTNVSACYNTLVKNIGTSATAPLVMNASVTGLGVNAAGNNDGVAIKRMFLSNTRVGPYSFVNSDTNILIENVSGDYADTTVQAGLNATMKNVGITSATTGQGSTYGTHWITRFISTTSGFAEILCNEPTTTSAPQCFVSGGAPQFNSSGSLLLTKVGDSVTWEMPFFAIGYTAFSNTAPTITGTNVTFGTRWGNHDIEFQVNTGSGYGGTWLNLTAANLIAQTFNSTSGFKLKIRATCAIASATNVITNMRVALTTTSSDQSTKLYPLNINSVSFTGIPADTDMVVLTAGTTTVLYSLDAASTFVYTYSGSQTVDVGFIKQGYVPYYIRNLSLTAVDSSIPVAMTADRNFI